MPIFYGLTNLIKSLVTIVVVKARQYFFNHDEIELFGAAVHFQAWC